MRWECKRMRCECERMGWECALFASHALASYAYNGRENALITGVNQCTIRGLMEGMNIEKSSQGCYKTIHVGFCDSHYNNIMDIQNRWPYSKVAYPAIIVLFSCLMEVNHGVRTGPNYYFREIKSYFEVVPWYMCNGDYLHWREIICHGIGKVIKETVKKYH